MVKSKTITEWQNICKRTLGAKVNKKYYNDEFYGDELEEWAEESRERFSGSGKYLLAAVVALLLTGSAAGDIMGNMSEITAKTGSVNGGTGTWKDELDAFIKNLSEKGLISQDAGEEKTDEDIRILEKNSKRN